MYACVCNKTICTTCSTECAKCKKKGHAEFSVLPPIPEKGPPSFPCHKLDIEELQAHVRVLMEELPLTSAQQKSQRSSAKRRLGRFSLPAPRAARNSRPTLRRQTWWT